MKLSNFNLAFIFASFLCILPAVRCGQCGGKRCITNLLDVLTTCGSDCVTDSNCGVGQVCFDPESGCDNDDPCCSSCDDPCFSSRSSTVVMDKGKTLVKDLQVGDYVLTTTGDFKKVYTIDHRNADIPTEFVQLHTSATEGPIELTAGHLVFLHSKVDPITASGVKVGDILRSVIAENSETEPAVVTEIAQVTRNGLWNPITEDGTIVVDGIVTSTYNSVALVGGDAYIEISGYKLVSLQDFFHVLLTPYRSACMSLPTSMTLSLCGIVEDDEFNLYDKVGLKVMNACKSQPPMIWNALVIGALVFFSALYCVFENPIMFGVMFFSALAMYKSSKKSTI